MTRSQPPTVSPDDAFEQCRFPWNVILDVRTGVEFSEKHFAGSIHIPLDRLKSSLVRLDPAEHHFLLCQSGKRASKAAKLLLENQFVHFSLIAGGMDAWERHGLPLERTKRRTLPLMRQVRMVTGMLTLTGFTRWCGPALILARMPWNRSTTAWGASCQTRPAQP